MESTGQLTAQPPPDQWTVPLHVADEIKSRSDASENGLEGD